MVNKLLRGVADASGNAKTVTDKFLTVNGCLASDEQWSTFDNEWQAYLKDRKFKKDPRTQKYVFHASTFWADQFGLMPKGLTFLEKQRLYRHLIKIICDHTEYRFGWGVSLDDFRRYEEDWPGIGTIFQQAGTYLSHKCFDQNAMWAEEKGYEPKIDYIFDRGDTFWKEMFKQYREAANDAPETMKIGELDKRNKADYSPIQAADIVAWECQRYFRDLSAYHLSGVHTKMPTPRKELNMLAGQKANCAVFMLKVYQHLELERKEYFTELMDRARSDGVKISIGANDLFQSEDEWIKAYLAVASEKKVKRK